MSTLVTNSGLVLETNAINNIFLDPCKPYNIIDHPFNSPRLRKRSLYRHICFLYQKAPRQINEAINITGDNFL